ncbi:MAG: hypothetical protein K8T25_25110 [Planctomycetia bacterium]|nr:hypothetical protein [Planctomycetia bacterium]
MVLWLAVVLVSLCLPTRHAAAADRRLLYVATPGIQDQLQYGGHGLLVFDIDAEHRFVKRIPIGGLDKNGKPLNIKGICASAETGRIHISTKASLMCLDMRTEKLIWERKYDKGCDRMALSPDGKTIYQPSFEQDQWYVLDAATGDEIARLTPNSHAHNTVFGISGQRCYLAGLGSPLLRVADAANNRIDRTVGPFADNIRPFTINGNETLVFACVNNCLGFEIGDLKSGKKLARVEVTGFPQGKVARHGCPSHGIGMTPDEKEMWVCDAHNRRLHIFDARMIPPKQLASVACRDEPGWVTFSIDGTLAYPSSGDVIDVKTRRVVGKLTDEKDREVGSEKMLEIDWQDGKPIRAGNQFGVGRMVRQID